MTLSNPKVTVLMPVYNSKLFLDEAISSILEQTFKDFEFIIIDDGSTDSSPEIIKKWSEKDNRIRLYSQSNQGIVHALNSGIRHARGKYIARMDADDIALPGRLDKQYHFLEEHSSVGVIASRVRIVDEHGKDLGDIWPEDKCLSYEQILQQLPISNCIAHPSVMASTKLLRRYGYRNQLHAEDADLWLRMLSDGVVIEKLPQKLLKYRVHPKSITQSANRAEGIEKQLRLKKNYLMHQLKKKKWGGVEKAVLKSYFVDSQTKIETNGNSKFKKYGFKLARKGLRASKKISRFSSIRIERNSLTNQYFKKPPITSTKPRLLVLIPWMTPGGGDKVMLDICSFLRSSYEIHIITTEVELNNEWRGRYDKFSKNIVHLPQLVKYLQNKSFFLAKYCVSYDIDTILISNSISGYRSIPQIVKDHPKVKIIDLLHGQGGIAEGGGSPYLMQPYEEYISTHITVTKYLNNYLQSTYNNSPKKIVTIHNGVDTKYFNPNDISSEEARNTLGLPKRAFVVSFLGRLSVEKRPLVFLDIAKRMASSTGVKYIMAGTGPMQQEVNDYIEDAGLKDTIYQFGEYEDAKVFLAATDVLVMTSEMEGLPLSLLDAGAMGVPVVAPAVGGIPEYVLEGQNGMLVDPDRNSASEYVKRIKVILSGNAFSSKFIRDYTIEHFSLEKMADEYERIFKP